MFLFMEITRRVFFGKRRTIVSSRFVVIGACLLPLVCMHLSMCYHAYTCSGGFY